MTQFVPGGDDPFDFSFPDPDVGAGDPLFGFEDDPVEHLDDLVLDSDDFLDG